MLNKLHFSLNAASERSPTGFCKSSLPLLSWLSLIKTSANSPATQSKTTLINLSLINIYSFEIYHPKIP